MNPTRTMHLSWCKDKAIAEIDDGHPEQITQALQTLIADLGNHPETKHHPLIAIATLEAFGGHINSKEELERLLSGFG